MLRIAYLKNSLGLLLLLVTACAPKAPEQRLPYYNTPDFTPMFLTEQSDIVRKVNHTIAPAGLIDQDRQPLVPAVVKGKIHVADFIFTSCGNICPVMTTQMGRVGKAFEKDPSVVILSYSVTPWIDTPEKLKQYKYNSHINKLDWHFLTGSKSAIYNMARKQYFAEESLGYSKDSTQFLHTEHFILVDATGRIRGIYNGTLQLEAEQLIKDIRTLKNEPVL